MSAAADWHGPRMRTATLPAAVPVVDENQRRFESTLRKLDRMIERGEHTDVATAAKFSLLTLREHGINAKLGGSLAAYQYGAERPPGDVDIELESGRDLKSAYNILSSTGKCRFNGERLRLGNGEFTKGKTGILDVEFRGLFMGTKAVISLDLVNENNSSFNRDIKSPERTGSPPVGLSSDWRLIVNYLDRRLNRRDRSLEKNDAAQIYDIIRRGGYDRDTIEREIRSRVKHGYRTEYMETLDDMMGEASSARRSESRHGTNRQRKDSGCVIG